MDTPPVKMWPDPVDVTVTYEPLPDHVWVVSRWSFGGGGDDDRAIVAVCRDARRAYEIAAQYADAEVMAYPLDREP